MAKKPGLTLKARGLTSMYEPGTHDKKKTASHASLGLSATKPLKTQAAAGLGVYMAAGVMGLSGLAVKSGPCRASPTG
jgi:hypothetical protein